MTINLSSYEEAIEYVKKTHLNNQAFMRRISDIRDQLKGRVTLKIKNHKLTTSYQNLSILYSI